MKHICANSVNASDSSTLLPQQRYINRARQNSAAEWPIRLMAVKFLDVRNPPTALSGALAIFWAVTRGAQVITAAWGIGIPSPVLQIAIWFASVAGIVFIAAAGNDGLDNDVLPTYPAGYGAPPFALPNVVSVMATERPDHTAIAAADARDDKAWFSNYGDASVEAAIASTTGGKDDKIALTGKGRGTETPAAVSDVVGPERAEDLSP